MNDSISRADKDIVYKEDVLKLIRMMPPEEGITRALLIQSVNELDFVEEHEKIPVTLKITRIGKWVKQNPMVDTEECSECGYNIQGEELETPFCPWCGANMRGETER